MNRIADKAQLTILRQERLSPQQVGVDMSVKVLDKTNEPISGYPFKVHAGSELLLEGITDDSGEYKGQSLVTVQEGTQKKVFLVLEDSQITDWKDLGQKAPELPQILDLDVTVLDATGRPLVAYPFKVQIEHEGPLDAVTDANGVFHSETVLAQADSTRRKVNLVLKVVTVLPKEAPKPAEMLQEVLSGKRPVRKGEELRLSKETYRVSGDIVVEAGASLQIDPGTEIEFADGVGILCNGLLKAIGTKKAPIVFRPSLKSWGNITLRSENARGSHLEYCLIEGGGGLGVDTNNRPIIYKEGHRPHTTIGGAIFLSSLDPEFEPDDKPEKTVINNVIFRRNSALNGQVIYAEKSSVSLGNCLIENNGKGNLSSGLVCLVEGEHTIREITVRENQGGTPVVLSSCGSVLVESSNIKDNLSENASGAIEVYQSKLIVKDTNVNGNTGGKAGAMHIESSDVTLDGCTFVDNRHKETDRPCIQAMGSDLKIVRSTVKNPSSTGVQASGISASDSTIDFSETALSHGPISLSQCKGKLVKCTVRHSPRGGIGIYGSSIVSLDECVVTENLKVGLKILDGAEVTLKNTQITKNRNPGECSAGLYAYSESGQTTKVQLIGCNITSNVAETHSGLFFSVGSGGSGNLQIVDSKISDNPTDAGLAFYVSSGVNLRESGSSIQRPFFWKKGDF